jgi:hypothetical protein
MKPELNTMLILSTAHIVPKTANRYGYDLGQGTLVYVSEETDWREEIVTEYPDLKGPFELAVSVGAEWIMFDCDGPVMGELPVYEWEDEG